MALALGIGAAAGLGLWADLLILPFLVAAAVPLGLRAVFGRRSTVIGSRMPLLALEAGAVAVGFCLGAAPLLLANLANGGATLAQTLAITGHGAARRPLGGGPLPSLIGQAAGTLLVALPRVLGSTALCAACAPWRARPP